MDQPFKTTDDAGDDFWYHYLKISKVIDVVENNSTIKNDFEKIYSLFCGMSLVHGEMRIWNN